MSIPTSPFGRPTSRAFEPQPAFGQANNANNSPLGVTSFGGTTPFGIPAGGSVSGGASPGVFGVVSTRSPLPFSSEAAFGAFASSAFGGFASSTTAFRTTSTPAFVSDSSPAFGTRGNAFGPTKGPISGSGGAVGASSIPDFRASCSSSLSFGSSPAFGPSKTAFRSNQFGSESHGAHTGSQVATRTFDGTEFGNSSFGGQHRGNRVAPFPPTTEAKTGVLAHDKLQSICGMSVPVYKYKSHGELRWKDYQCGDKGGPHHAGQSGVSIGPGASFSIPRPTFSRSSSFSSTTASNAFSSAPASATTSNPISFTTSSNELSMTAPSPLVPNPSSNAGFWRPPGTSPFGCSSSLTSVVRSPPSALEVSAPPSILSSSVSVTLGPSPSVISAPATQSSPLLCSTKPPIAETASFRQTPTSFSQTTAPFGQTTTPTLGQIHAFSTASSGSGGSLFPSTPSPVLSSNAAAISQTNPSCSLPFQTSEVAETSGVCSLGNLGQTQAAGTGGFGSQYAFGQSHCGQSPINGSSSVVQQALVTSPFGTLPAVQQLSVVQYGISSMPVADKPSPVRKSPLLSARHLSLRQTRLPARKYHPVEGVQRVPFFYDGDNAPSKPEAAQVIPRRNPRSLVIGPEYWPAREQKPCRLKKTSAGENDVVSKDGPLEEQADFVKAREKMKGVHDDFSLQNDEEYVITKAAGESAIEALMPKLRQPDYYTEPHVKELAAKERAEPGFCCRVKNFIVGRLDYGHIKFIGETDVRRLDLESLIRFNDHEVIVYTDESKRPPIGQGLNKPAEVTLLNIKCIDKKTGKKYIEGSKVEKYKEMLKKVAEKQGAEFVSYDPIKGEWKFKVRHFS